MRGLIRVGCVLGLLAAGYGMGRSGLFEAEPAQAQLANQQLGEDAQDKVKAAYEALLAAKDALVSEGKYNPATDTLNAFAILSGGVDALSDLETGRGVDPETYAALYAGFANGDIRSDFAKDAQGRLTYKNKIVQMYPISRLKAAFNSRNSLAGIE